MSAYHQSTSASTDVKSTTDSALASFATENTDRSDIWNLFTKKKSSDGSVECRRCDAVILRPKPDKLKSHLTKCSGYTWAEKRTRESAAHERAEEAARKKRRTNGSLDSLSLAERYEDSEAPQLQNCRVSQSVLDKLIATFVFESGSAFRIVSSTSFKRLINALAPKLEVPSPKRVGDDLLEEAYRELMAELFEELADQPYIGIVLDGLGSLKHEKLINFVAVGPNFAPLHLKTIAVTIVSQTGKFLADLILRVVDWLEKIIGIGKVATITSDNAPNMDKSWTIIESTRGILCNGCAAHTLNLLLQDIAKLEVVNEVTSSAEAITSYFMRRSQLLARLKEEKLGMARTDTSNAWGHCFTTPVVTRWYSSYECLVNVIRNREAVTRVFDDDDFMETFRSTKKRRMQLPPLSRAPTSTQKSKRTKKKSRKAREAQEAQVEKEHETKSPKAIGFERVESIVRDDEFWQKGEQVIQLLKPIIKKLGLMESDRCCISLVYWGFRDLLKNPTYREPRFLEATAKKIRSLIKSRWDNTHTDAMGIAYYLDPSQDPRGFVGNDRHKTKKHIRQVAKRLGYSQDEVEQAFHQAGVFWNLKQDWSPQQRRTHGRTAPMEWWGERRDKYPILYRIARRVFTMPASSAASERIWSTHKYICTDRRNQLGIAKLEKLVSLFWNRRENKAVPMVLSDPSALADSALIEPVRSDEGRDEVPDGICYEECYDSNIAEANEDSRSSEDEDDDEDDEDEQETQHESTRRAIPYYVDNSYEYLGEL